MSICLYCGKEEPNYKPPGNVDDYVCSSCVIMLLDRTQEQLNELYKACREREYVGKEEAIELFLIEQEEENDGNQNDERSTNGSRIGRDIGLKKELHRKFKKTRFAIL